MKGPGLRLDLDVRRLWRCRTCRTERHTPGRVTFVRCHFCQDHPQMELVETQRPDREPPAALDLLIDLHPDDVDAPAFVPAHLREPEEAPDSSASDPVDEQPTADPPAEKATETPSEPSSGDGDSSGSRKKRRKKNRRRRKAASRQESPAESDSTEASPATSPPPNSSSSSPDSFGAGIETPDT